MKKFLFTVIATLMSATMSLAQNTLVATLTHGDEITVYYGSEALRSAYGASASGDVITLSGGTFYGLLITQAVTIRGAGVDAETPTCITKETRINIPDSDTCRFSIEGVSFLENLWLCGSCSNPYFLKCNFSSVYFQNTSGDHESSAIKDALFVNCKFPEGVQLDGSATAVFSHCFFQSYRNDASQSSTPSSAQFINCIVGGDLRNFYRSSFINCIICGHNDYAFSLPADVTVMNCAALNCQIYFNRYNNGNIYSNLQGNNISSTTSTYEELFKSYRESYSDSETFELTDEAKAAHAN